MPPKAQITAEQILNAAYELVRNEGVEHLTARALAKKLNCSTQPIYLSFQDMNGLKSALTEKALSVLQSYMQKNTAENQSPLLSKMLGYVQFANEERQLYRLIFSSGNLKLDKTQAIIAENDELGLNLLVYAHGIIMMKSFGTLTIEWEQLKKMIVKAYKHFLSPLKSE
ncbi:MAG: TetR family transcriptional regulator [Eubacteriales bacterium]|nr:TetR family transcriptional regulator [Eubacteriales bacterium]